MPTKSAIHGVVNSLSISENSCKQRLQFTIIKELKNYVLPENILFSMEKVIEDIANYDDDEAERLIKAMIGHVSDD